MIDNAPAHTPSKSFSNITIKFNPPKMTAHIQPLDAGIIRSFKANYRKLLRERLIEELKIEIIAILVSLML